MRTVRSVPVVVTPVGVALVGGEDGRSAVLLHVWPYVVLAGVSLAPDAPFETIGIAGLVGANFWRRGPVSGGQRTDDHQPT